MYDNEFTDILDTNERILWSDKPHMIVHLASGLPMLIIGIIWGILDAFFITGFMGFGGPGEFGGFGGIVGFLSIFMLLHLMPLWIGIGNMVRLIFVYRNTFFCYTDKRIITKTGFLGVDYKIKDFYNIGNVEVNINPIENMLGVGTIRIDEDYVYEGHGKNRRSRRIGDRLYGIQNPYDVFKKLKEIVMDIKSDINYPNDFRPESNPGYNTRYDKKK